VTARIVADDADGRTAAVAVLEAGGVVAIPTDTVYGISVSLTTIGGIERLFAIKRRPLDKSIALLLADVGQASSIAVVSVAAAALAEACWPGGLTIVAAQRPDVPFPTELTGGAATIGLRVPDHPAPRALAAAIGPLPTTSANVSGQPEAPDAAEIAATLGDAIDLILDGGPAHGGPASTVVDCTGDVARIVRAGTVTRERVAAILAAAGVPLEPARD
jgi:L-threonylcarbamoyladenylate synthase